MRYQARIVERGNGLCDVGQYVAAGGSVYRVISMDGRIHCGPAGAGNYVYGVVEDADWDDLDDDIEPWCSVDIGEEIDEDIE